ncbi:flagellar motor protein MotB [Limnobacter sp.]|uniref:flagellar motor protein MotB n=1 Tax=Limnobacter sp. TaxID=2003368 RepID=UPI003514DA05
MFGQHLPQRNNRDEGERPFWISYADLMTALMVLFLVVMVTSLSQMARTQEELISPPIERETTPKSISPVTTDISIREQEIGGICSELSQQTAATNPNVIVDCSLQRISFGEAGRFKTDEYTLSDIGQQALQDTLELLLATANSPLGKKWLKQVVVEGFTDTDGSYLYNLNLSLKRSEWVMCLILGHAGKNPIDLTAEERKQIKQLFLAGGVSFNNIRDSKDASRRVELRLQFYGIGETPPPNPFYASKFNDSSGERCMLRP